MGIVMGRHELKAELERLRVADPGARVVFTNGCFDILHAGHVRYLAHARSLGSALVVGLNTDASVSALKPGRPIVSESERAEVLSALASVDYVTLFGEDTPYELIKLLRPDVLVKGGDWAVVDIVGHDLVADTRSLPFSAGLSTTNIIERVLSGCGAEAETGPSHEDPPLDDADMDTEWVEAFVTYDPVEAEIIRDLLRSGGVRVREVSLKVGAYPVNVGRMGEVKLYVPAPDADSAAALIADIPTEE